MGQQKSSPFTRRHFFNMNLSELVSDQKHRQDLYQLEELVKLLENDTDRDDWVKLLKDIGEKYSSV
jgi:hypothetical protein